MKGEYEAKVPFDWSEREKWLDLPVPLDEFKQRLHGLQDLIHRDNVDCMIIYGGVSDPANVQYITGFDSWWGDTMLYVPTKGEDLIFVTNGVFHGELAHSNMHTHWIKDVRYVLHPHSAEKPQKVSDIMAGILKGKGHSTKKIAVCNIDKVPYYLMKSFSDNLPNADLISGFPYLQKLRRIKSKHEIALFKKACECTDAGINKALESIELGISERELYSIIAREAISKGAHNFMASVLFGTRSSIKNTMIPSEYRLKAGEIVNMDVLTKVSGYSTDTHRNAIKGKPKDDLIKRMADAVVDAGMKVLKEVGPGVVIHDLQKIMYDHMKKENLLAFDYTETLFAHGCGLDLVEEPFFFWGNSQKLEPGMTFYLEPCLVKHDLGTTCWESLIVVTPNGYDKLSNAKDRTW